MTKNSDMPGVFFTCQGGMEVDATLQNKDLVSRSCRVQFMYCAQFSVESRI